MLTVYDWRYDEVAPLLPEKTTERDMCGIVVFIMNAHSHSLRKSCTMYTGGSSRSTSTRTRSAGGGGIGICGSHTVYFLRNACQPAPSLAPSPELLKSTLCFAV